MEALRRSISSFFSRIMTREYLDCLAFPSIGSVAVHTYASMRDPGAPDASGCRSHSRALQACLNKNDSELARCQFVLHVLMDCMSRSGGGS